jgi:hypothetical protein
MYPYSEPVGKINYIRNSVKAVVDAYNGKITLYISEPQDPIVQCYIQLFPDIFQPIDNMPEDLRQHIRYPEGLMRIQAQMYCAYHMTNPQVFYNKEDLWNIAKSSGGVMRPYYTIMKLEGAEKEEYILMIPFTPARKDNMIAWMAARCDMPNYGKLLVYIFPKKKQVYGPAQIEARIDQDTFISKELSLWNQMGSRVIRGSLLVIPVEDALLYVEPLYLSAEKGKIPELKRVIVAFGSKIAMKDTLEESLAEIFGGKIERRVKEKKIKGEEIVETVEAETMSQEELIIQAKKHFTEAERCQRRGDWAGYGEALEKLKMVLNILAEE